MACATIGHSYLAFHAATVHLLSAPHHYPIPDALLAGNPMARGQDARWEAMLVNPAAYGALMSAHENSDGPEAHKPFIISGSGRRGHWAILAQNRAGI